MLELIYIGVLTGLLDFKEMTSPTVLAGVLAASIALGILFKPRYGAYRGSIGEALESVEREREEERQWKSRFLEK